MFSAVLILATAARAHSPHDVSTVLSFAPDGALVSNDSDLLALSSDGGSTFVYRYWHDGVATCVMTSSAGRWIVGGVTAGAWSTDDAGLSFRFAGGPEGVTACARGEAFYVGGPGGAWRSDDGLDWEVLGEPTSWSTLSLAVDEDERLLAVGSDGVVRRWDGGAWEDLGASDAQVVAVDGELLVAGRPDGPLLASDDGGDSWAEVESSPSGVRVLAVDGGTWLAATEGQAVWVSLDDGATWKLDDVGLDELALGNGGPQDGIHYFRLAFHEGRWYLASFEGLYWKEPGEDRWNQGDIDNIPRVRTVRWMGDGDLLVGAYGGGVYRGTPGGDDWREISGGISWSYPKLVVVPESGGEEVFVCSGTALFISRNGGDTWDSAEVLFAETGDQVTLAPDYPDDPRMAVGGRTNDNESAVSISQDGGRTWSWQILPGNCTAKPRALGWHGDQTWLVCGNEGGVFLSEDGGINWAQTATLGHEIHAMAAGSPTLFASDDGLWSTEDGVTLEPLALQGYAVFAVDIGPDGRVWAGVAGHGLAVVDSDGTVQWRGFPEGDLVEALDVDADGRIALALRSGAWTSDDDGKTWQLACPYDRVDDRLQHWWLDGWTEVDAEWASTLVAQAGEAGAWAELTVNAEQIRILGVAREGAVVSFQVDDGEVETRTWDMGAEPGLLWGVDLEAGANRHVVRLTIEAGSVLLDGAERWVTGAPDLPEQGAEAAPKSRCGCGGKSAVLVLPVTWIGWGRRRRRVVPR